MNQDPRYLRSRAKLHAAIFEIAAEQDPSTITVTSVASRANVHRSTVYEHADSPEHLLRLAIEAELDELEEPFTGGNFSVGEMFQRTLAYLETREQVYTRIADETGVVIADALSQHYMRHVLRHTNAQGDDAFPTLRVSIDHSEVQRILLGSICGAIVRIQGEWLRLPQPRDPNIALEFIRHVVPSWCPWAL